MPVSAHSEVPMFRGPTKADITPLSQPKIPNLFFPKNILPVISYLNLTLWISPLTPDKILVLSKGLTFCPNHKVDKFETIKYLHLFTRKMLLRSMYDKGQLGPDTGRSFSERQALANLNALLEESDPRDLIDTIDLGALLKQVYDSYIAPTTPTTSSK